MLELARRSSACISPQQVLGSASCKPHPAKSAHFWSRYLCVCLSVSLRICLSVCWSICASARLYTWLDVCLSGLSVCPSAPLSDRLPASSLSVSVHVCLRLPRCRLTVLWGSVEAMGGSQIWYLQANRTWRHACVSAKLLSMCSASTRTPGLRLSICRSEACSQHAQSAFLLLASVMRLQCMGTLHLHAHSSLLPQVCYTSLCLGFRVCRVEGSNINRQI